MTVRRDMGNTPSQSYLDGFLAATGAAALRPPPATGEEPVDPLELLAACARDNQPPGPADARRLQELGCFYEAPRQDAFRLRLRLPGGRLQRSQLAGLAGITQELGGGWLEWNGHGGLDLPAVAVRDVAQAFQRIEALGLTTRGADPAPLAPATPEPSTGVRLPSGRLLSAQLRRLAAWLDARHLAGVALVEPGSLRLLSPGSAEDNEALHGVLDPGPALAGEKGTA